MQSLDNQIQEFSGELAQTSNPTAQSIIFDEKAFANVQRIAEVMANSNVTVPNHLHKNIGDCMAITIQALSWGMNPWPVAQKTHLVSGVLGYEAQLVSAVINSMAPTKDRIHYEWFGPWENVIGNFVEKTSQKGNSYTAPGWKLADEKGVGIRAWATLKGENEPRVLELLLSQAQPRNSTLWATDPKQQLAYLVTKRWARLYCPDVILGVYTPDELSPQTQERDITPTSAATEKPSTRTAGLKNKIAAKTKGEVIEHESEPAQTDSDLWLKISMAIDSAENAESLKKAVESVDQLSEDLKQKARFAYKYRECELKGLPVTIEQQDGVAHIINTETGDIIY